MALSFAISLAGRVHGSNVDLFVPIANAIAATDVCDRPTRAFKFFLTTQKSPETSQNLGSYLAAPRTGAARRSDQRACHEAFLWTLVDLEKRV